MRSFGQDLLAVPERLREAEVLMGVQQIGPVESWHEIGAVGEPAFENGFAALGDAPAPAFYRDNQGFVHLRGRITNAPVDGTTYARAFTLPVGYRPSATERFELVPQATGPAPCHFFVDPDGSVRTIKAYTLLDGTVFR